MRHLMHLRNALLFCVPAAILMQGCQAPQGDAQVQPLPAETYEADCTLEYGEGQSAALHLTRCGDSLWDAAFTEPPALAGIILTFDGNAVSASYKGLAFTVPKTALPAKNMLTLLTEALDAAHAAESLPCSPQDDGSQLCQGECAGGSYTLTFDPDGQPLQFEVPSQPLKITFSGFTVLQESGTTEPAGTDITTAETAADTSETAAVTETTA